MLSMTQSYNHYHIALYVFLAIGILITLGAFFGCLGVCRESQCLLVSVSVAQLQNPITKCKVPLPTRTQPTQSALVRPQKNSNSLNYFDCSLFIYAHSLICFFAVLLCDTHCDGGTNRRRCLGVPQQKQTGWYGACGGQVVCAGGVRTVQHELAHRHLWYTAKECKYYHA